MNKNGLLCVKSIATLILVVGLVALTILETETFADVFKTCITSVITFYFVHQTDKNKGS